MTPSPSTPLPEANAVYLHWHQAAQGQAGDRSQAQDKQALESGYALIWRSWIAQLQGGRASLPPSSAPDAKAWHQATAEDVARFLQIRPGQRAHHQPERQISEVTRRRYWRLLDRIYDHALLQGWVASNPVQAVHRPAPEQATGHVLPQTLWTALPRHFPGSDDLQSARDHAVLHLLYELALAPEEVRALTMEALRGADQAPLAEADTPCFVQLQGLRAAQNRCLELPARSQAALAAWLRFRRRSGSPADAQAPLFESRKGGPLTIRALFHIASKTIALAHQACAGHARPLPLARMGPQVLRNTAIVQWLRAGVAPTEVIQRIGVEQVRALAHLQHCIDAEQPIRWS
ncbi:site-specific integrase [Acidovorax sp. Be4]|uniref:Site-specific integrase n=1 Tax=Acidovorax bellezanensis TaxID=2976702 RepID=A0ABT2PRD5_9BURK|nr:site-specific integrase [Acidovorax sp. Be4]MCT9811847.1 site-specific integrase [Acidovorax sp. Be4]